MGANGKGNGKKQDRDEEPSDHAEGAKLKNGKGNGAHAGGEGDAPEKREAAHGEEGEEAPAAAAREAEEPAKREAAKREAEEPRAGGEPEARKPADPGKEAPQAEPVRGAAWGHPFARFEQAWTRLESRLLTGVLVSLIVALVAWVFLKGLCEPVTTRTGAVFRCLLLTIGLGLAGLRVTRGQGQDKQRTAAMMGIAVGIGLTFVWRAMAGAMDRGVVGYFDNVRGWLQDGSTFALLGGPRGLATRLTLWLALLGGSLATASNKHIHVDVVFRFIPKPARMPIAIVNYLFAAGVCLAAVWGFTDHIAITSYGSNADDRPAAKIENALHHVNNHLFFTRKQIGLDLRSLPHVLKGEKYDQWMTAAAWNEWVDGAGFEDHFEPAKVKNLRIQDGTHPPFVVSPDGETTRGALVHTLSLVFPFGLLAIGLRFLLRALLTLSGHFEADPDDAHKEELRGAEEGGAS